MRKMLGCCIVSLGLFVGGCMATLDGLAQDGIAGLKYIDDAITSEK